MTEFDTVIRGGLVVDGSGAEPVRADLALANGRIAVVSPGLEAERRGAREIDATGRYVLPGFIDGHAHADSLLGERRVQEAYLRQGVTTLVLGQDGLGFAPGGTAAAEYVARYFAAVDGAAPPGFERGGTVGALLASYDGAGPLNAAVLVPAGNVRAEVMGTADRPASPDELERMVELVAHAVSDGAVGLSTGLDYVPGFFAGTDELAALCAPVAAANGVYVSHLRGYSRERIGDSLSEAARIGALSGAGVHVSHLHGPAELVEATIGDALAAHGVAVSFDSYPYLRGSTILAMIALPSELQEGGIDKTLLRLADPAVRRFLREEFYPGNDRVYSAVLSYLSAPELAWAEGLSLQDAAAGWHGDLTDFVCDALIACDLAVGCVMANGADRTEDDLRRLLRHPGQLASSDAIFLGSSPHPRGWGAFARLLARHVRELGDWSWGEAAWHLSGHAATRFGLGDRGRIAEGAIADLVVLDPLTVADTASYERPTTPATGVTHVLVAGQVVLDAGELTGSRAGRGIRGPANSTAMNPA